MQVDWYNGIVDIENICIPGDQLRIFPPLLPIRVKAAYIGKLLLKTEFKSWFLYNTQATVEDVSLCLETFSTSELSAQEFEEYSQSLREFYTKCSRKRCKILDNQLSKYIRRPQHVTDVFLRNLLETLVAKLFAQFKANIENIYIRLEDIYSGLSGPLCCGLFLEKLFVDRAFFRNSQVSWDLTSLEAAADIHKYVHLKNLNVFLNSYVFPVSSSMCSASEFLQQMKIPEQRSQYQWLISSFCVKGSLNLMFPPVDAPDSLKFSLDIQSSEWNVSASTEQIRNIAYISTYMARHAQLTRRRLKNRLPRCRPKKSSNIAEWWQYAYRCVLDQMDVPTKVCPLCACANTFESPKGHISSMPKVLDDLHRSHDEIEDIVRKKRISKNIVLENFLSEEELILGRLAAYYFTYRKCYFPTMNGNNFENIDKVKKSRVVGDNEIFFNFVLQFYQWNQKGTSFFETWIKLQLAHFTASAWDYHEDDKRPGNPPLLSLKGTDVGIVFSTAKQLPNGYEMWSDRELSMSGYLAIHMGSATLSAYDEYAPTLQKLSTITFLSGKEKPPLNLLLCFYRNFRLCWEANMFVHSKEWLECLATRKGPLIAIDIFGIEANFSSLDAIVRIVRFSLNCIPRMPMIRAQDTLTAFRVFSPRAYWTQICRKIQQAKLKLDIKLDSAEINVLCKDIQSKAKIGLQLEKWSFRNASPSSKSNCFDDTDSPSLFLYQDWILDFQRVALDLSLDSLSKDKLQILRIHTEIPFQLLFSTCVIASDLYLSSLNIIFNGGLYSAIDFSKMKVISSLAKTVGQVTEQLGKKLISPNRVVYVLWGKLERENVRVKGFIEVHQDGLLCLCYHRMNEDGIICERIAAVQVESNGELKSLKLNKTSTEVYNLEPDSVYAMENFLRLLTTMQSSHQDYCPPEPFLIAYKRKLNFCLSIDLKVELKLPSSSSEADSSNILVCQFKALELVGKFSVSSLTLNSNFQAMKILYGNETLDQSNIYVELAKRPELNAKEAETNIHSSTCRDISSMESSSLVLQMSKETRNDSTNFHISILLHSLQGSIWSNRIMEILELLTRVRGLLAVSENHSGSHARKTKSRGVQFGLDLRAYSSQVVFIYPNISSPSNNGTVFRKLALSFNELYFGLNTSYQEERLRLCVDFGTVKILHSLIKEENDDVVSQEEKILSFERKDEHTFPLHFDMILRHESAQNLLLLTFKLSQLHSFYNHFAIMDLVVIILRFVALGNSPTLNKKRGDNVASTLLKLEFTVTDPIIGIPCFSDDNGALCNYLQCTSRCIQLEITVNNNNDKGRPNSNSIRIDIKGDDWKIDQGFIAVKETKESVFVLVPLLYPSSIHLSISLGASQPLNLCISSSSLSILVRKASVLDILRLVFPTFVTYPYAQLQGNATHVRKEESPSNKAISIKHQFGKISIKWFDEDAELLLPNSVFAMELPVQTLEDLTGWNLWNDFIDAEWIRNELISNHFVLQLFVGKVVDNSNDTCGTKLDMNIAFESLHIGEAYSLLYEWRYFSRIGSVVAIGNCSLSLSMSPVSFGIQLTCNDNQPIQLFLGTTGMKQWISNVVYIAKEIPSYFNSIRVDTPHHHPMESATKQRQFVWNIGVPIELHFVAGISKTRNIQVMDGFHELILSLNANLRGTIQTQPYLQVHELSCSLHQLDCTHHIWNQDKPYKLLAPVEISLTLGTEDSQVSQDMVSSSESIVFSMTRIEGNFSMEDVFLILSCIKECKEYFSSSNTSRPVRMTREMEAMVPAMSFSYMEQLSYNLYVRLDDVCLSLVSYERGSVFSLVEVVLDSIQANGLFFPWTRDYTFHVSLLCRLYQFAIVHGTWNVLVEPCPIDLVASKRWTEDGNDQQMRIVLGSAIQITVTETWLFSLISWFAKWKDVSVLFFSKVSFIELQRFENSLEKENNEIQSIVEAFHPAPSGRFLWIRNETGLDITLKECKWDKDKTVFCEEQSLSSNSEQIVYIHSRHLDRIHQRTDREEESSMYIFEQSVKITVGSRHSYAQTTGHLRLFQEDVYFLPVFDGSNEMGTLCLQVSLLEAQWEIIIRSVFKLVNATNLGMLFLLEDSVGNLYDPSTNYSSNSSRVLSQLYQVPFLDNESQDVARGQEKSQSNASIEKAVLLRPGSNFMIPFVFCSWTCYVRFALEADDKRRDGHEMLVSRWSGAVQLKEEFILKGKHVLLYFPIRWTSISPNDIIAVSHNNRRENNVLTHPFYIAERREHSQTVSKRPLDMLGAVLLQCRTNGEMMIKAPLRLKNELTLAVSYRLYVGFEHSDDDLVEWISWNDLHGRLQPGETVQKCCVYSSCLVAVEWFELGDLSGTFMQSSQFHHRLDKFVLLRIDSEFLRYNNENSSERKDTLQEHYVTFHHSDGRLLRLLLRLCLEDNNDDSSLLVCLSCPYWISNCTGIPLLFRDSFASSICPTIKDIHSGVEDTFPIMVSFNPSTHTGMPPMIGRKGLHYLTIWVPECPKSPAVPVSILGFHSSTLRVAHSCVHRLSKLSIYSSLRRKLFEAAAFLRLNIYTQFHPTYEGSKAVSILPETLFCYQLSEEDLSLEGGLQRFVSLGIEMDHVAVHSMYRNGPKIDRLVESESQASRKLFQFISLQDKVPLLHQNVPTRNRPKKLCIKIGFRMSWQYAEEEEEESGATVVSPVQEEDKRNNYFFLWSHWFVVNAPSEFTVAVNIPKDMQQLRRMQSLQALDAIRKRPFAVFDSAHPEDFMMDRIFWTVRTSRDTSTRTQMIILKKPILRTRTEFKNSTIFLIAYAQEGYLHGIRLIRPQTEERLIWSDPLAPRVLSIFVQHRQGIARFRLDSKNIGTQVISGQWMNCDTTDFSYYQLNAIVELVGRVLTIRLETLVRRENNSDYWTTTLYSSIARSWNSLLLPWKRNIQHDKMKSDSHQYLSSTTTTRATKRNQTVVQVTIPFIGISWIDDIELWEELVYVSLSHVEFTSQHKKVQLTLSHFQCDQSITSSDSPVLLASLQHPFLSILLEMESLEAVRHYNQLDISVAEFALKMDNELLFRLLEMIKQRAKYFSQVLDSFHIMEDIWCCCRRQEAEGGSSTTSPSASEIFAQLVSPQLNRTDIPCYFQHVILHPIACRFSFTMKGNFESGWLPWMESWMRNTGLLLGEIEDNLLWVDQLELNNAVETLDALSRNVLWHVIKSLWSNMFTALGGLSALGDMTSTFLHLRRGTLQFFVEPIRGSLTGEPGSLWKGVHRGTIMLGRSCIYSIAQPVSRLSWAIAKGIAYGSMNRSFLSTLSAHEQEWKHATDIWNGTLMGLQKWRTCLSYTCHVTPFHDDQETCVTNNNNNDSIAAVTSILTLPLSGFFFFLSNVAEGTRNMTGLQVPEMERIRLPRYVMKGHPIQKYDAFAARGQYLLRQTFPQRRERYVMHIEQCIAPQPHEEDEDCCYYYILSSTHIIALKQPFSTQDRQLSSSSHRLTLLWRIPLTAIVQVNHPTNSRSRDENEYAVEILFRLQSSGWQTALHWLDPTGMVASSSAVITTFLRRHEKNPTYDATESVVVIRETRMQRQQAIAQQQPTLMEWQHKLSHLVNEDSSSPHV